MENWDPMRESYESNQFRSYSAGLGGQLQIQRSDKRGGSKTVKLFVGNIPIQISSDGLRSLFSRTGNLISASVVRPREEHQTTTFGFVEMANAVDAEKAIREMHGFRINMMRLKVNVAMTSEEKEAYKKRKEEQALMSAVEDFDEDDLDKDLEIAPKKSAQTNKQPSAPSMDARNTSAEPSFMGKGRGAMLKKVASEMNEKGDFSRLQQSLGRQPAMMNGQHSPMVSQFKNLSIQVDNSASKASSRTARVKGAGNALVNALTDQDSQLLTPLGRGTRPSSVGRGERGAGTKRDGYETDWTSYGNTGQRGRGRGRGRGNYQRGRGRGNFHDRFYDDRYYDGQGYYDNRYYDDQAYRGPPMMGRGWPYGGGYVTPAPPAYYVDPSYMPVVAPNTLLQPAYVNPSLQTPVPTVNSALKQAKQPEPDPPLVKAECAVCNKLGSFRCGKCKTPYCSRQCQADDWTKHGHKLKCSDLAKYHEDIHAMKDFDVDVSDDLIPQVKALIEKATGEKIEITKKAAPSKGQPSPAASVQSKASPQPSLHHSPAVRTEKPRDAGSLREKSGPRSSQVSPAAPQTRQSQEQQMSDERGSRATRPEVSRGQGSNVRPANRRGCFNCGDESHMRNECPKSQMRNEGPSNQGCFNCGDKSHTRKNCPKPYGCCNVCGDTSHRRNECPQQQMNRKPPSNKPSITHGIMNSAPTVAAESVDAELEALQNPPKTHQVATKAKRGSPPPKKSIMSAQLPLNTETRVCVAHVQDPDNIYVHILNDDTAQQLGKITTLLATKYTDSATCDVSSVMSGELYAGRYSIDNQWYRVQVHKVIDGTVMVHFVDFGNTETCPISELRVLDQELESLSAQALHCALSGVTPLGSVWESSPQVYEHHIPPNVEYSVVCQSMSDGRFNKIHRVQLKTGDGKSVVDSLVSAGMAKRVDDTPAGGAKPGDKRATNQADCPIVKASELQKEISRVEVGSEELMVVTDVKSPLAFAVQMVSEVFQQFHGRLSRIYNESNTQEYRPAEVGELVVARFLADTDNSWYRAEVLKLMDNKVKLRYVDYLNNDDVPFSMVRKATMFCTEIPAQGLRCMLNNIEVPETGFWSPEVMALMGHLCSHPVKGKIVSKENNVLTLEIFMIDTGEWFNQMVKSLLVRESSPRGSSASNNSKISKSPKSGTSPKSPGNLGVVSSAKELQKSPTIDAVIPSKKVIERSTLPLDGSRISVSVTQVVAINAVYVQFQEQSMIQELARISIGLNEECPGMSICKPQNGDFIAALYSDGSWYRGLVKSKTDAGLYSVQFVDYGNTDDVKTENLRPLDEKFANLPAMAVRCQLNGSENIGDPKLLQDIKLLENSLVLVKALDVRNGLFTVEMFLQEGQNINELLHLSPQDKQSEVAEEDNSQAVVAETRNEKAIKVENIVNDNLMQSNVPSNNVPSSIIPAKTLLTDTLTKAVVVYIENLTSFYIHVAEPETEESLQTVTVGVHNACESSSNIYIPRLGEYVGARYTDEEVTAWYRAKVLGIAQDEGENKYEVLIIDFGNQGWVPEKDIRVLPDDLMTIPALAVRCSLNRATGTEDKAMVEDFQITKTNFMEVTVLAKQEDRYQVDLIGSSQDGSVKFSVSTFLFGEEENGVTVEQNIKTENVSMENGPSEAPTHEAVVDDQDLYSRKTSVETDHSYGKSGTPEKVQTGPQLTPPEENGASSPTLEVNKKSLMVSASAPISASPRMELPLDQKIGAVVFWVENIRSLYIQLTDETMQYEFVALLGELHQACTSDSREHRPVVGEIVGAFFSDGEEAWYRGEILELLPERKCRVFFIDYGNTDVVDMKLIRKIDRKLQAHTRMAILCALAGDGKETAEMLTKLKQYQNIELQMTVLSESDGKYNVVLCTGDSGENLNKLIGLKLSEEAAKSSTDIVDNLPKQVTPNRDSLPRKVSSPPRGEQKSFFTQTLTKAWPEKKDFKVIITSVVRPNLFHCQEFTGLERIQELNMLGETMKLECEPAQHAGGLKFEVGELCCARFPVEGLDWYRATVLEVFPDNTMKVEYVDYGNQADVPLTQIRPATEEYTRLPLLAFRCSLHGVVPNGQKWSDEAILQLTSLQDRPLEATLVSRNGDVFELEITCENGTSVSQALIDAEMAKPATEESGMSEKEKLIRQNEILQKQVELYRKQMTEMKKNTAMKK
ncbi:tudor domain-containing 6-like [Mya arenaria]|uniref:tudor domain-containing 6-like n=1 Tax=Mya arenaria TaxID=6604 RepID=UPI0022E56B8D|nr:tudor domain-containing 6-like [Mya arenaria]XP_052771758.1 tudor domain-containing 6-like [Mya arenaria]XP_052771759.1 tudor domain-containing 6-like [Mya arenaria]